MLLEIFGQFIESDKIVGVRTGNTDSTSSIETVSTNSGRVYWFEKTIPELVDEINKQRRLAENPVAAKPVKRPVKPFPDLGE